jgi:TPR repeat protein
MAFTDVEVQTAREGASSTVGATGRDLYRLGLICASGQGGPVDLVAAHKWFNLAVARGLGAARDSRNEVASLMSREELQRAQRAAREWLNLH